jgi:hypothetical protein
LKKEVSIRGVDGGTGQDGLAMSRPLDMFGGFLDIVKVNCSCFSILNPIVVDYLYGSKEVSKYIRERRIYVS